MTPSAIVDNACCIMISPYMTHGFAYYYQLDPSIDVLGALRVISNFCPIFDENPLQQTE